MPTKRVTLERVTTITERANVEVEAKNRGDAIYHARPTDGDWVKISEDVKTTVVKPAKAAE